MSIMKILVGGSAMAVMLSACAMPALYTPGTLASGKGGIALDPPDQTGVREGYWRVEQGIELYHFSRGEGEPVLVIHGGPGVPFQTSWQGLDGITGYRFTYYHQRGCGASTIPIDRFDSRNYPQNVQKLDHALGMAAQLADIERIRRILGVEKLTLIGHSYGGFLATLYALEFPNRVKRMVLVSPASLLSFPPADGGMDRVQEYLSAESKTRYDEFRKAYFDYGSIFSKSEVELAELNALYGEFYMEALANTGVPPAGGTAASYRPGGWVVHAVYMSMGMKYDYRPLCSGIPAPALVIHGDRDIPPESSRQGIRGRHPRRAAGRHRRCEPLQLRGETGGVFPRRGGFPEGVSGAPPLSQTGPNRYTSRQPWEVVDMKLPVMHIRASVFGLALIAFFLPFVVVSCPDYGKASVSGVELAFGTTVKGSQLSSVTQNQRIQPQGFALVAFASAAAGIALSYLKKKPSFIACTVAALTGVAMLSLLRNQIGREAYKMAADNLRVRYEAGYWLAAAAFVAALVVTLLFNPSKKWSVNPQKRKRRR